MVDEVKDILPELNERQKLFCQQYLRTSFNGTQAAIRAGYSEKTAGAIASENLTKLEIKAEIKRLLIEAKLSKEQTEKMISDIAQSSLNDYMTPVERYEVPRIRVSLNQIIAGIKEEIEEDEEYMFRVDLDEKEIAQIETKQTTRRRRIARLEIRLDRNPLATDFVDGEPVKVVEMKLDLVKLAADKEKGKIKSWKMGRHGPEIELYAADGALRDMAKIHGSYAPEKQELTGKDGEPLGPQLSGDQFSKLLDKLNGGK